MKITRTSMFTGKVSSMDLNVTEEQMAIYDEGKVLIQNVFPNLTAYEREFIKTGVSPEEWDSVFGQVEE